MSELKKQTSELKKQTQALIDRLDEKNTIEKLMINRPVLPVGSLLVLSLRDSAAAHVELIKKIGDKEIEEAAVYYYSLLVNKYCEYQTGSQ